MSVDFSNTLVIGVSSRALFDLEEENRIYETEHIEAYRKHLHEHETEPLNPGTAYYLVKSLLELNKLVEKPIVEVIVMSKNSPETGVRMLNSITHYQLGITRIALTGGEPLAPYMEAFGIDLFLSKDPEDVQKIIDSSKCAAALIYAPPKSFHSNSNRVKIAFDADAVLFSEESEVRYKKEGLDAFRDFEAKHENDPLQEGPFANLLMKLSKIQEQLPTGIENSPLRLAIVTARNAPSHMRVIKTLRKWGVYVDEAYFLGNLDKYKVLDAYGAQIFFDDQEAHLNKAREVVPSGKVPYKTDSELKKLSEEKEMVV
jgi:5'-nucleotidase